MWFSTRGGLWSTTVIRVAASDELEVLRAIDDDAGTLYAEWGLDLALSATHSFAMAESALWQRALDAQSVFLACDPPEQAVGFAVLMLLDDAAYLDQLSVRRSAMRRGVGRSLLQTAIDWARQQQQRALTLTTYHHLPFNRPFYERHGFELLPPAQVTPGLTHHLDEQRRFLPLPEQRVAMRLLLG